VSSYTGLIVFIGGCNKTKVINWKIQVVPSVKHALKLGHPNYTYA